MADVDPTIPQLRYRKKPLPPVTDVLTELRRALTYSAELKGFVWVAPIGPCAKAWAGKKAGGDDGSGYDSVNLLGHRLKVHRLVWLWHHGEWPTGMLDHVNGDRKDNRIENLREATMAENVRNRVKRSGGLATGVSRDKSGGFKARIQRPNGQKIYLGTFQTEAEAAAAYVGAATVLHGEFSVFLSR